MESKPIRVAVVDDERDTLKAYEQMFSRLSRETDATFSVTPFADGLDLVSDYKSFDLIFLDIDMNKLNGLETARQLRKMDESVMLIFVTRLAQYAINGYDYNAFDFVLKPLDYATFRMKMKRALKTLLRRRTKNVCIRCDGVSKVIPCDTLKYVEVQGHYLVYHTTDGDLRTYGTLAEAAEQLDDTDFVSCHRCFLVNAAFVKDIKLNTVVVGDDELPVSRLRKRGFVSHMAEWFGGNR